MSSLPTWRVRRVPLSELEATLNEADSLGYGVYNLYDPDEDQTDAYTGMPLITVVFQLGFKEPGTLIDPDLDEDEEEEDDENTDGLLEATLYELLEATGICPFCSKVLPMEESDKDT